MCFIPAVLVPIVVADVVLSALEKTTEDSLEKRINVFFRKKIRPQIEGRIYGNEVFTLTVPFIARNEGSLIKDSEVEQLVKRLGFHFGFTNVSCVYKKFKVISSVMRCSLEYDGYYELKFDVNPVWYRGVRSPYARL